jgi:hypothetical protein
MGCSTEPEAASTRRGRDSSTPCEPASIFTTRDLSPGSLGWLRSIAQERISAAAMLVGMLREAER